MTEPLSTAEVDLSEFDTRKPRGCKVPTLALKPEQRSKLDAAFLSSKISTYAIGKVLEKWGVGIAQNTLQKHRDKNCTCAKVDV